MKRENSPGDGNSNSNCNPNPQACASCKHQRKKCDEKCELAPYFPASSYQEFQYAQKLFGVSNIQKMLNSVEPHQRQATAESILIEGTIRHFDPVHGCLGVVRRLNSQIQAYEKQIEDAKQLVAFIHENKQQEQLKHILKGLSLSPFPPPFTPSMVESNQFYGFNFQEPNQFHHLPGISDHLNSNGGLYNYESTMEEGTDMMQVIYQMMDPYQTDQAFACLDAPGDPESPERHPLESLSDEEVAENVDNLSSLKG